MRKLPTIEEFLGREYGENPVVFNKDEDEKLTAWALKQAEKKKALA